MILLTSVFIFVLAFLVAWRVTPRILRAYANSGRVDSPGGRKQQKEPIPYGAGLAVLLGFAAPFSLGMLAAWLAWDGAPQLLETHAAGIRSKAVMMVSILAGSSCMLVMGRLDDKHDLSAVKRFCVQLLAACLVVAAGVRITLFIASPTIQIAITILWLVFVTNATNFIDNMDGLLAGSALNSSLALGAIAALNGQLFVGAFAIALAGAIAGVLPFNRHPARIYLGDEGSMFLGFLLACLSTLLTYAKTDTPNSFDLRPFIVPLLCLSVPVVDGSFVILSRLGRGKAPWTPGLDHLSHRLVDCGQSRVSAVRWLWIAGLLCSAVAIVLQHQTQMAFLFAGIFVIAAIYSCSRGVRT
ncbi:MAG: UDP-GlcNAc:undecaprenyl-phosphate GlcNAc-1-phosphate transferase [Planctomycetota bacterium]